MFFGADQFRQIITENPELVPTLGTANTNWQDEFYQRTDFMT
jgi:hypothetical protein